MAAACTIRSRDQHSSIDASTVPTISMHDSAGSAAARYDGPGTDARPGGCTARRFSGTDSGTPPGSLSDSNTVRTSDHAATQTDGHFPQPVNDDVNIFLCPEGSETRMAVRVPRTITFEELATLVERKLQRPMLLSFIDDGDHIEIDDKHGIDMFFDQGTTNLKLVCTEPLRTRISESFVGPAVALGTIPGLNRITSGGFQMPSLRGYNFAESSAQSRAKSFVTVESLSSPASESFDETDCGPVPNIAAHDDPISEVGTGYTTDSYKPIKELKQFTGHAEAVYCCSFNPAGDRFVTSSKDKSVRVWNVNDMSDVKLMKGGHKGFMLTCEFSPDGKRVVSGSDDCTVRIWNALTGDKLHSLKGHDAKVCACMWNPTGTHVVSASNDKTLRIWNAANGKVEVTLKGHGHAVFTCAFSQTDGGQHVVSGADDKLIKIWTWKNSKELRSLAGHTGPVWSVRFSNDDQWVCSASMDHEIKLWDAKMGHQIREFTGHLSPIHQAMFSPDNKYIISCARDCGIMVWDVETGHCVDTLLGHCSTVYRVDVRKDQLVSASMDNTVRLWRFDHK